MKIERKTKKAVQEVVAHRFRSTDGKKQENLIKKSSYYKQTFFME